jgi:hypothetical protein
MINKEIQNRNITLAEVTQQAANDVIRAIYDANTEDQKLAVKKRTPIKLILDWKEAASIGHFYTSNT